MKNSKKNTARDKLLKNREKEYVLMNSPDDSTSVATGDEESIIMIDNPDDADAGYRQK